MPRSPSELSRRRERRWRLRAVARTMVRLAAALFALSIGIVVVYRFVTVPLAPLMVLRNVEQALDRQCAVRLDKDWVGVDAISPHLQHAVFCAEDQLFSPRALCVPLRLRCPQYKS